MHIAHLTSVHSRHDTRIFHKMCKSGVGHGFRETLIVADGEGEAVEAGVSICDVGKPAGRVDRMWGATKRVYRAALSINADLYHLHDPELMPIGLKLKRLGKQVVFDAHEDLPKQLLSKPYLNKPLRRILSVILARYEAHACKRFDGVIAATPVIRDKFLAVNPTTIDITNFPLPNELEPQASWEDKRTEVCYVGGISSIRGIKEVCAAMGRVMSNVRLNLTGLFSELGMERCVKTMPGWQRVNSMGFLDRAGVQRVLGRSLAGLVTFHPLPNHLNAQPNKMFEYMSAGIPVIASDFPLWRKIISEKDCGILVNPFDPNAIAKAIDYVVENPGEAERMGRNGRKAVETIYNWNREEKKLLKFYERILQN